MTISDEARAVVLLADYIGVDASSKINAVGLGFSVVLIGPNGLSAPQHVAALIDVPSRYVGEEFALSLELRGVMADTPVRVPGPTGHPDALRIQQMTRVDPVNLPGYYVPQEMFCRVQAAIAFTNGIPLLPGRFYAWRLEIDGNHHPAWEAHFYVPGSPPPPVFGGPAGPAGIPPIPAL